MFISVPRDDADTLLLLRIIRNITLRWQVDIFAAPALKPRGVAGDQWASTCDEGLDSSGNGKGAHPGSDSRAFFSKHVGQKQPALFSGIGRNGCSAHQHSGPGLHSKNAPQRMQRAF
jgi:hypothetical protein